ncbi:MAG: CsbD family protein [Gemmatimonas sp.]
MLGRLREHWGVFTHRQIDIVRGQRAQVVGRLQRRYGDAEAGRLSVSAFETRAD